MPVPEPIQFQSKNQKLLARYFPEVESALREIEETGFALDGEIVSPGGFGALQLRLHPAASRTSKQIPRTFHKKRYNPTFPRKFARTHFLTSTRKRPANTMPYVKFRQSRAVNIEEIENAMTYLEDAIEEGTDGDALECIYERLERELTALKARNDTRGRIRERRERRATLAAA